MKKRKPAYLAFRLGKEIFAAPAVKILEVLAPQPVTSIIGSKDMVKGVISFRGNIIPVLEIKHRFAMQVQPNQKEYVIIVFDISLNKKNVLIGAIADAVEDVLPVEDADIQPIPEKGLKFDAELVSGMIKRDDTFIKLIDIDKVFQKEE